MKNIVIIGATGSTGLYLTEYLSQGKYCLTATGLKNRKTEYYQKRNINYITLDIANKSDFEQLPKDNIDCVILLAGIMPSRMKGYDPHKYLDTNIKGTLNSLEYCRENKIPKIIFALSHSDVAGHWNTGNYIKDDARRILNYKGDHAVYIISKVAASDLIEHYHQDYGIQTIIFRLPTIYCYWPDSTMYVNGEKREMAFMTFMQKAINGETIEIWGDPNKPKDIIYIKDFIQLVENAMQSENAQGIYNVGTGIPTTLNEQINGVVEIFCDPNKRSEIVYCPEKPSQISYLYDVSKAKKELGYEVKYPYRKMLEDMKTEMNNSIFKEIL